MLVMAKCKIQLYVIMFASDLRQVSGFLWFPFTNKTNYHDTSEILLKVTLNTITLKTIKIIQSKQQILIFFFYKDHFVHMCIFITISMKGKFYKTG
jgi:hypothetical protein